MFFENTHREIMDKIKYFPHDVNARYDPKLVLLVATLGKGAGYLYWELVEMLYENANNKLPTDYKLLSKILHDNEKKIKKVVENFELFKLSSDGKFFYSVRSKDTIEKMKNVHQKRSNAGRKGMSQRWGNEKTDNENITSLYQSYNKVDNNAITFKKSVTQSNTVKHTISNIVCDGRTQNFWEWFNQNALLKYPEDFCVWYRKYGHNPYSDSLENSFEEWKKLSANEQELCLSVVENYVSLRSNSSQRHNPWRYLQSKIFLISELHTFANSEGDSGFQTPKTAQESRAEKRMKEVYGTEIDENQFRNKVEKWEN